MSKNQTRRVRAEDIGALAVLSLGASALTGTLSLTHSTQGSGPGRDAQAFFEQLFGGINPLLVIAIVSVVGVVSLSLLQSRGWFEILKKRAIMRGVVRSAALATLFAAAMVIRDLVIPFPENINVAWPQSLIFYPAIGYVAEIVFHALPLTLLLVILGSLFKDLKTDRFVWLCILLASLPEPTLQWLAEENPFSWAGAFVWVHVFTFNLLQLYVLRLYGFVSVYSLRFFYYMYWHIAWGFLRLQVLY